MSAEAVDYADIRERLEARPDVDADDLGQILALATFEATGLWGPSADDYADHAGAIHEVAHEAMLKATEPNHTTPLEEDIVVEGFEDDTLDVLEVIGDLRPMGPELARIVIARAIDDLSFSEVGELAGVSDASRRYHGALETLRTRAHARDQEQARLEGLWAGEAEPPKPIPVIYYAPLAKPLPPDQVPNERFSLYPENMGLTYRDWLNRYIGYLRDYLAEQRVANAPLSHKDFMQRKYGFAITSPVTSSIHSNCLHILNTRTGFKNATVLDSELTHLGTLVILEGILGVTHHDLAKRREIMADMTGIYVPPELNLHKLGETEFEVRRSDLYGFHHVRGMTPQEEAEYLDDLQAQAEGL